MAIKNAVVTYALEQIPEVLAHAEASIALNRFMNEHSDVFDQYVKLAITFNTTRESAGMRVREMCIELGHGVTCGPFVFKHFATKYNVQKLYDIVGEDAFRNMGGTVISVPTPQMDKKLIEVRIAQNVIAKEVRDAFVNDIPNYTQPEKVVVP